MTAHRHDFPGIGHNRPCPICGGAPIDDETVEQVAAAMYESRGDDGVLRDWSTASDYWREPFRDMARAALETVRHQL